REEAIQGAFDLDIPCKVVHLSAVPGELPPLKFLVKGIPILHVGVLSLDPPATGIGHAIRKARAGVEAAPGGIAVRLEAIGNAVTIVAESAAKSATRLGESLWAGTMTHAEGGAAQAWPIGTVRVRLQGPLLDALPGFGDAQASFDDLASRLPALGDPAAVCATTEHTFDHWARAITSRRVGLTLSGGGPYGVIHIPLLRRLIARKLPIDLLSGTSVGSSVGAYFAVLGDEGLDLFIAHALAMNLACLASIVSSAAFQAVIGFDLGPVPLIDTEIPFFPVVTDADIGIEWDLRHGSYALGVRASGSLPPLGPTIIGNRRYLDGGLVANVPVNVLRDEGAALIIASNAISSVSPSGRANLARFGIFQPIVEVAQELSLLGRLDDLRRMIPLIFRTVGDAQANAADVTYRPSYRDVSFWSSFSQEDLRRGEQSPDLDRRVTELENRWRSLLRHPPSRVRIDAESNRLELLSPLTFTEQDLVDPSCLPILGEAALFLGQRSEGLRITRLGVEVAATSQVSADRRAQAVVSALVQSAVDRARLAPKGVLLPPASEAAEGVTFPILEQHLSDAEARRKLAELEARARSAERSALAKALTMGAEWSCRRGDLDLGRLLALEAAFLDPGLTTDAVLRHALSRRGWTVRCILGVKSVQQMAIRPDGRRLAAGSADGMVRLWDMATETEGPRVERPLAEISHVGSADPGIAGVAWSHDGKLLATAGFDGNVNVYAVAHDDTMTLVFQGESGTWSQWGVAFAPEDARLLGTSGGSRAHVAVWETAARDGASTPRIVEHDGDVKRAAWSPDGALVAAGTDRGSLWVWSPGDEAPTPRRIAAVPGLIADLDWCPKRGDLLAFASGNQATILGPVEGGPEVVLGGHSRAVRHVAFSPDGTRLATASDDGSARIWSAEGRFLMNLRGDDGPLEGVTWHPQGLLVATFSEQGTAVIWDVESGEPVARLLGHEGSIIAGA
ncbi:MAG: patatin-like phospholipase family protein, partial [Minicystis sp.]